MILALLASCGDDGDGEGEATATNPAPEETSSSSPSEPDRIRYAIASLAAYTWPTFVATELGMFEACGIDLELIVSQGGGPALQAVLGGAADLAAPATDQGILPIEEGADLVGVSAESGNLPFSLMVAEGVETFEDLRGQRLAVSTLEGGNSGLLRDMLAEEGLSAGDYELVPGGGNSERIAGLQAGQYAASLISQPQDFALEEQGLKRLAYSTDYVDSYQYGIVMGNKSWVEENRDAVVRFLQARLQAEEFIKDPANRQEAAQILAEVTETPVETALATYDLYADTELGWVRWDPPGIQAILDTYAGREFEDAETYIDMPLVEEAEERGAC